MKNFFLISVMMLFAVTFAIAENDTGDNPAGQAIGNITLVQNAGAENNNTATNEEIQEVQNDAIDDETSKESEIISESNFGAKVRLLELRKSAVKSRIYAEEIIKILSGKGQTVAELQGITEEMKLIETELKTFGEGANFSAEHFVEIKRDLKELNKEFRDIAGKNLTSGDKKKLQDSLKNNTELSGLQDDIHLVLKNLNAERVGKILKKMNKTDENLTEEIRNGNVSKDQVKNKLKDIFGKLGDKEKEKVKEAVKEKNDKRIQLRNKIAEKIRLENVLVRKERYLERVKLLKSQAAVDRVNRQIELLNRVQNKLSIKDEQLSNQRAQLQMEIDKSEGELKNEDAGNRNSPSGSGGGKK